MEYYLILRLVIIASLAILLNILAGKAILKIKQIQIEKGYDTTQLNFIKNSLGFIIFTIAVFLIIYSIPSLKTLGASLLAGAGILAAIVGFASQEAFSNIISGLFILIFKPFRIGDILQFKDGLKGKVQDITFRHTVIKDFENKRIIMPNSVISNETLINSSFEDEKIRKRINFSISYESDMDLAIAIIREEIMKHPFCFDNRIVKNETTPVVDVFILDLADYAVVIQARVWTENQLMAFKLKCEILKSIKERFDKEGIEIPYPHQVQIHRNDF